MLSRYNIIIYTISMEITQLTGMFVEYGAVGVLLALLFWYSKTQFNEERKQRNNLQTKLDKVQSDFMLFKDDVIKKQSEINMQLIEALNKNQEIIFKVQEYLKKLSDRHDSN